MRSAFAVLALAAAAAASPMPQGVSSAVAPSSSAPAGCESSYDGIFQVTVVKAPSKRAVEKRATLTCTLQDGVMKDAQGRTGYIASNYQFQFDAPPQAGAIYTAGWSVCANSSIALGGSTIFYQCYSGGFYNLYSESTGAQCEPIYIDVINGGGSGAATAASDGQPEATSAGPYASQITDGQVQASSAVSQISDGQVQATSAASAVSQISDGQVQATSAAAGVSQISDGQVQATSAAAVPISQISDGQIQATTAYAPVSQISDGQIQATTAAVVTQISDGQVQATSAPLSTGYPVSQISDGQIQATAASNATYSTPTPAQFTGAAIRPVPVAQFGAIAAGFLGLAVL